MLLNTHLNIRFKKFNGEWWVGEALPDNANYIDWDDVSPNKAVPIRYPFDDGGYGMLIAVRAESSDDEHIMDAADEYIRAVKSLYDKPND